MYLGKKEQNELSNSKINNNIQLLFTQKYVKRVTRQKNSPLKFRESNYKRSGKIKTGGKSLKFCSLGNENPENIKLLQKKYTNSMKMDSSNNNDLQKSISKSRLKDLDIRQIQSITEQVETHKEMQQSIIICNQLLQKKIRETTIKKPLKNLSQLQTKLNRLSHSQNYSIQKRKQLQA